MVSSPVRALKITLLNFLFARPNIGMDDVPKPRKKSGLVEHLVVSGTRPGVDNASDPRDEISIPTIFFTKLYFYLASCQIYGYWWQYV